MNCTLRINDQPSVTVRSEELELHQVCCVLRFNCGAQSESRRECEVIIKGHVPRLEILRQFCNDSPRSYQLGFATLSTAQALLRVVSHIPCIIDSELRKYSEDIACAEVCLVVPECWSQE